MTKKEKQTQSVSNYPLLPQPQPLLSLLDRGFFTYPSTIISSATMEVLAAGENLERFKEGKELVSHGTRVEIFTNEEQRQVRLVKGNNQLTIGITDIGKIFKNNKTIKKVFALTLIMVNKQALSNGELIKDYVVCPLEEMVDLGLYTTTNNARRGFNTAIKALKGLYYDGEIEVNKNTKDEIIGLSPIRYGRISSNQCYIYIEPNFNWKAMVRYYTILPKFYFALPNRASDLLLYIFTLARQNGKQIKEKGYFTISFRAIQARLSLPSEVGNKKPSQTIIQPMEKAIEQIEEELNKSNNKGDFTLLPVYNIDGNAKEILEQGFLKVSFKGSYAEKFIEMAKKKGNKIEAQAQKKKRISEAAIAINMAKKQQQEEDKKSKQAELEQQQL